MPRPLCVLLAAVLCGGCAGHCGARGGLPPNAPPLVTDADGKQYHLISRGPYKAYYTPWGRLQRLEFDSNGDGKPDQFSYHDGQKYPHEVDFDLDFDGKIDRWEVHDPATGRLLRIGGSRKGNGRADVWTDLDANGRPVSKAYDDDGDGRPERWEYFAPDGSVERVELDTDRDGRPDRWQHWQSGRLVSEELDLDHDGRPDRRLRYGADGRVAAMETLASH